MFNKTGNWLYKYIVRTNVFVSLCSVAIYFSGLLFLGPEKIKFFSADTVLIFCSTLLIYNVSQSKFGIVHFIKFRIKRSIVLFVITLIPVVVLTWELRLATLIYFAHLGIISVLYNSPLLNRIKYLPLRSIPLIKIFLIAYVWSSIGSFLPVFTHDLKIDSPVFLLFFAQFAFILSITLPFDIRDFYRDIKSNLRTLPGALGIGRTKRLAYLALTIHIVLLVFVTSAAWIFIPLFVLSFLLVKNSNASKPAYYYTFFIDGLIILQFLILYLVRMI